MDLFLSKLIPLSIYPLGFALVVSILAMGILRLSPRWARFLLLVAVGVLWVASMPIVADYLNWTLERQYRCGAGGNGLHRHLSGSTHRD